MEACVNNNKAKPQQLELASLLFAWTMLTSTEKMQEVVSLIIYIYICFNRFNFLFKGCNEEYGIPQRSDNRKCMLLSKAILSDTRSIAFNCFTEIPLLQKSISKEILF